MSVALYGRAPAVKPIVLCLVKVGLLLCCAVPLNWGIFGRMYFSRHISQLHSTFSLLAALLLRVAR